MKPIDSVNDRNCFKTAIAIRGVTLAGSINLLKRIQPSNKLALLKNSFMLVFIGKIMHWIYNMNL